MSVPGTAGGMSLACGGVVVYQLCQKKIDWHIVRGCTVGFAVFGTFWRGTRDNAKVHKTTAEKKEDISSVETTQVKKEESSAHKTSLSMRERRESLYQMPEAEWLIPGLVRHGNLVAICAKPKSLKSYLLMTMCVDISEGMPQRILSPNERTSPEFATTVYYIDGELNTDDIRKRFFNDPNYEYKNFNLVTRDEIARTESWVKWKLEEIRQSTKGNVVVAIDTFNSIFGNPEAKRFAPIIDDTLKDMQYKFLKEGRYLTILVCHHMKDPADGSTESRHIEKGTAMRQKFDVILFLDKFNEGTALLTLGEIRGWADDGKVKQERLICEEGKNPYMEFVAEIDKKDIGKLSGTSLDQVEQECLRRLTNDSSLLNKLEPREERAINLRLIDEKTPDEIAVEMGIEKSHVSKLICTAKDKIYPDRPKRGKKKNKKAKSTS